SAVKAAYLDTPVKVPESPGRKAPAWLKWPFKKSAKATPEDPQFHAPAPAPKRPPMPTPQPVVPVMPEPMVFEDNAEPPASRRQKIMKRVKTLLIAGSVAVIVVGVAKTAMEFLFSDTPPAA